MIWNTEQFKPTGGQRTIDKKQLISAIKNDQMMSARSFGSQSNFMNKDSLTYSAGDEERMMNRDTSIKKQIFGDLENNQINFTEEIRFSQPAQLNTASPAYRDLSNNRVVVNEPQPFSHESFSTIGHNQQLSNQWSTKGNVSENPISGNRIIINSQKGGILSQQILQDQNQNIINKNGTTAYDSPNHHVGLGEYLRSELKAEPEPELEYKLIDKPKKDSVKHSSNRIVLQQTSSNQQQLSQNQQPEKAERSPQLPPPSPSSRRKPEISSLMKDKPSRYSNNASMEPSPQSSFTQSHQLYHQVQPQMTPASNSQIPILNSNNTQAPVFPNKSVQMEQHTVSSEQVVQPVMPAQSMHKPMLQMHNGSTRHQEGIQQQRISEVKRQYEAPGHTVPMLAGKGSSIPTNSVKQNQPEQQAQAFEIKHTPQPEKSVSNPVVETPIIKRQPETQKLDNDARFNGDLNSFYPNLKPGQVIYETADGSRRIVDEKDIPNLIQKQVITVQTSNSHTPVSQPQVQHVPEIKMPTTSKSAGPKAKSVSPSVLEEQLNHCPSPTTIQSPSQTQVGHISSSPKLEYAESGRVIENRPYIFDEHGNKVYVDPNNLSAFAKIARKAPQGALNQASQHVSAHPVHIGPNNSEISPVVQRAPVEHSKRHVVIEDAPVDHYHSSTQFVPGKESRRHKSKRSGSSRHKSSRSHRHRADDVYQVETHEHQISQTRLENHPTYYPQPNYIPASGVVQYNPIRIDEAEYYPIDRTTRRVYPGEELTDEVNGDSRSYSRGTSRSRSKHTSRRHNSKREHREPTVIRPMPAYSSVAVPTEPIYHRPSPLMDLHPINPNPSGYVQYMPSHSGFNSRGAADFDYPRTNLGISGIGDNLSRIGGPFNKTMEPPLGAFSRPFQPPTTPGRDALAPTFIGSTIDETLERIMKKTFS